VGEGDLRFYVAYGNAPERQCAFRQTLSRFNSLGPRVEWRRDAGQPFATILRWFTDAGEGEPRKSWLVVTRLGGDATCHTAYVEGSSSEANAIARRYADEFARTFDCRRDKPDFHLKTAGAAEIATWSTCE
jgi:hypothetical protein